MCVCVIFTIRNDGLTLQNPSVHTDCGFQQAKDWMLITQMLGSSTKLREKKRQRWMQEKARKICGFP